MSYRNLSNGYLDLTGYSNIKEDYYNISGDWWGSEGKCKERNTGGGSGVKALECERRGGLFWYPKCKAGTESDGAWLGCKDIVKCLPPNMDPNDTIYGVPSGQYWVCAPEKSGFAKIKNDPYKFRLPNGGCVSDPAYTKTNLCAPECVVPSGAWGPCKNGSMSVDTTKYTPVDCRLPPSKTCNDAECEAVWNDCAKFVNPVNGITTFENRQSLRQTKAPTGNGKSCSDPTIAAKYTLARSQFCSPINAVSAELEKKVNNKTSCYYLKPGDSNYRCL